MPQRSLADQEKWCRRLGLSVRMTAAQETAGRGTRGGTLVTTRRGPGQSDLDLGKRIKDALAGRATIAAWGGVLRGGIVIGSVYMWHSEGLSPKNLHLLGAIGEALRAQGRRARQCWTQRAIKAGA